MRQNIKILIGVAVVLVALCAVAGISMYTNTSDNNTTNNTTIELNNTTAENNTTVENTTTTQSSKTKSTSKSSSSSGDEVQSRTFTVSENEKGQNEGMEPGVYRETYTANDGPISVEKIR
ncbi:hypothetical protein [Methanosphaera sp.]